MIEHLTLRINIDDGIPLFKSSSTCLWPILGSVKEVESLPFPIAVYCSVDEAERIDDYLKDFISEMKELETSGFHCDIDKKTYKANLGAIICDAPARSFIKCIKTHNGYHCCERCVQRGELARKIILVDMMLTTTIQVAQLECGMV